MTSAAVVLAASTPSGAGGWALLIFTLLAITTALLYRSMTKQLRKVPKSFDRHDDSPADR